MGKDKNPNRQKHGRLPSGYHLNLGAQIKSSALRRQSSGSKTMARFLYSHWIKGDAASISCHLFVFLLGEGDPGLKPYPQHSESGTHRQK